MTRQVLRIWRGSTAPEKADDYEDYMLRTGMPGYRGTPGNRAAYFTRRSRGSTVEFCMVTVWEDLDAVRAFAGDDPEQAIFYPEDDEFLVDRELVVAHYDVFATGDDA